MGRPLLAATVSMAASNIVLTSSASGRVCTEVPNGVHPGQGVTTAPNAEAREDAKRRVLGFLQERTDPARSASSTS